MDKKTEGLNSSPFSLEPFKQFVKTTCGTMVLLAETI